MSTYEDKLLAARFAALAPEPLAADWDDVLGRAGRARTRRRRFADSLRSRPRRRLLVFAAVALVVVLGGASALAVRTVLHQGIVGLAPVGATPSTPQKGELVLNFLFGHTRGDRGRFHVSVYADGRMIWQRVGHYSRTGELRESTGLLERRLTPEGVQLVKAELRSTGLVDHDLHLSAERGLNFGFIDFRNGARRIRVTWGDDNILLLDVGADVQRQTPTPAQARALMRLDERLSNPASWLPASAWADAKQRAYVPSGYSVCYEGKKGTSRRGVLALLPAAAGELLRTQDVTPNEYTNVLGTFVLWCSQLTNEEARALERILDDAGVRGIKDVFGLTYGAGDVHVPGAEDFTLIVSPNLPDQG